MSLFLTQEDDLSLVAYISSNALSSNALTCVLQTFVGPDLSLPWVIDRLEARKGGDEQKGGVTMFTRLGNSHVCEIDVWSRGCSGQFWSGSLEFYADFVHPFFRCSPSAVADSQGKVLDTRNRKSVNTLDTTTEIYWTFTLPLDRQLALQKGDAVVFRGEKLRHWITPVTGGVRVILQIELSRV